MSLPNDAPESRLNRGSGFNLAPTKKKLTSVSFHLCFSAYRKYVTTLLIMFALAVYYSVYQTQVVGTFNPKGSLINYRAKVVEHPTLKCGCDVQTIPFRDFAVPTVAVNRACDWVEADLNATTSSCKELKLVGYCVSVRDACRQGKATVAWVLDEFNNSVVSSTCTCAGFPKSKHCLPPLRDCLSTRPFHPKEVLSTSNVLVTGNVYQYLRLLRIHYKRTVEARIRPTVSSYTYGKTDTFLLQNSAYPGGRYQVLNVGGVRVKLQGWRVNRGGS